MIQHVSFRLADSLPHELLDAWKAELGWREKPPLTVSDPRRIELCRRVEKYADAGHGASHLRKPEIAKLAQTALRYFDGERYRLLEWCVMPNHVHALVMPINGHLLADILHSWKSFTASRANKILGIADEFWQREYHDRFIRDARHLATVRDYVRDNPVAAGLVAQPEAWPFSSASTGSAGILPAVLKPSAGWKPALPVTAKSSLARAGRISTMTEIL
jgi:REP element-mobilizing transposase RayT